MAAQQILFAETIMGMKKAMSRLDDASESDDAARRPTNRGNKLKRKAKYIQAGHLDLADGPRVYRRNIEYNGYSRHIINRNPPRVDKDGDVVDDDESDSLPDLSDAEENPYADIRLEELLMPLTSAADLDKHPSLAVAFTNKVLEEMIQNAREMMEREQAALYKMKKLMVEFRGDDTWMPCGNLETELDTILLGPQRVAALAQASGVAFGSKWETASTGPTVANGEDAMEIDCTQENDQGVSILNAHAGAHDAYDGPAQVKVNGQQTTQPAAEATHSVNTKEGSVELSQEHNLNGIIPTTEALAEAGDSEPANRETIPLSTAVLDMAGTAITTDNLTKIEGDGEHLLDAIDREAEGRPLIEEGDAADPPYRMTTRARAQATGIDEMTNTALPHTSRISPAPSIPTVHPFFMVPSSSLPSRDFNLPYEEAGESRRLLTSYVQKQEEVCRGAARLYTGLQKALRLRKTVWQWCRAEGHVGEMSDGEDWYDKDEWGLEEDLKKGEEAEEEEVVTGKKTRGRRAVA